MYTMRFDMRAPAWGAPAAELYAAVPEMCSWAEQHGALATVLCEHHGSEDGYLPSPLMLAPAIAARTQNLPMNLILLLPFYEPVRLAEDMAVLDILSGGRTSYTLALGYRPEEFEHFGYKVGDRGRLCDEKLPLIRRLLAGETVAETTVTPNPLTKGGPTMMWGGGTVAAARRAGRYGLGMLGNGNAPGMQEAYEEACRKHGHEPGPTMFPDVSEPSVVFVADDVDQAWDELGEHLLHDVRTYAAWNPGTENAVGITRAYTIAELRENPASHIILSVPEAISRIQSGKVLNLSPLCGGLPPEIAWTYLKRVGEVVLPEAAASGS